jgi:polyphosphate kinase
MTETIDQHVEPLEEPTVRVPPELYLNRELSWLAFNERVLEEAEDPANPLLERVKFLSIFSSNLDEFFMIRVANLKRKLTAGIIDPGPDGLPPQALAPRLRDETQRLLTRQHEVFAQTILPELCICGIDILSVNDLEPEDRAALSSLFVRDLFPILTPQAIDRGRRFPHVSNQSLNLLVQLHGEDPEPRYARVKIPAVLDRLVRVPSSEYVGTGGRFVWLEELVAAEIVKLFPGNAVIAVYPFHVNRDSDIEFDDTDDDAIDLLHLVERQLSQRTFGVVTQIVVDVSMPEAVRSWLVSQLHATERDLYVVDGPLALEGLVCLLSLERPDLLDPPLVPASVHVMDGTTSEPIDWNEADVFAAIRHQDVMVQRPYQGFSTLTQFLGTAARDPDVVAIKQTLYRLGKNSPIIPLLMEARDDDTQVAVLMEVKARFDEENNIALAHELETAGVHVNYGLAGLKTHCKALLVVRREADGLRRYVHLSTGNYNAATSRIYEDIGIITANEDIAADVTELFNALTGYSRQDTYRTLIVAPPNMRGAIIERIDREIEQHKAQGGGRIIFKMNSLVDREVIRALYAASTAGVEIDLIIRGICCLRPSVPGWSQNIRVRSLVGRFLEHSRIYYFRNGGDDQIFLGSADMMERNLDRRVEVLFPILDPAHKSRLRDEILPAYLRDTANSRVLKADGTYQRVCQQPGATGEFDVQRWLIDFYRR